MPQPESEKPAFVLPGETDESLWLTKTQARLLLAVSQRQLERLARGGSIRKQQLPRAPNERAARVIYSRADIEKLLTGVRPKKEAVAIRDNPAGSPPAIANAALSLVTQAEAIDAIAHRIHELAREWWPAKTELPSTPFLSLDQAVTYSGLPRRLLIRKLNTGTLKGVKFSGEWYVKKADLDALELLPESASGASA